MKHAFLIMAYQNIGNLNRMLELLDDSRCHIILHLDAKANGDKAVLYVPRSARLTYVPSMNVRWGHSSIIECILRMMTCALAYPWDYCHYVTESDMPLKTVDEIDQVFSKNMGKEFIDFAPQNYEFAQYKCEVYHLFPGFSGYRNSRILKILNHGFAKLQWWLGFRRRKESYLHGSAFFPITRDFVYYIIGRAEEVRRAYAYTLAADEVWLQTLCKHSPYMDRVHALESKYIGNLQYIDWDRREGNSPHTFTETDYEDLIEQAEHTPICFARKFMENSAVAERLQQYLLRKAGRL